MFKNNIKFRKLLLDDYNSVLKLLYEVEWTGFPNINDQDQFVKFLNNIDRSVVAVEGSRIVGFASALCNDLSIGYVTMLAVSPNKQGQGIGSKLLRTLTGNDPNIKWVLFSLPKNFAFWEKQGFVFNRMLVKPRAFNKSFHKPTDLPEKKTIKKLIINYGNRIYRFNICQFHIFIKKIVNQTLRLQLFYICIDIFASI